MLPQTKMIAIRRNQQEQFDPKALGFEFTLQQIEARAMELQRSPFNPWAAEKLGQAGDLLF